MTGHRPGGAPTKPAAGRAALADLVDAVRQWEGLTARVGVFNAVAGNASAFSAEGSLPVMSAFQRLSRELRRPRADGLLTTPMSKPAKPQEIRCEDVSFPFPRTQNLKLRPGEKWDDGRTVRIDEND